MIEIDMKFPSCCKECFALDDFSGIYPYCIISKRYEGYYFNVRTKRMPFCPLKDNETRVLTLDEVKAIGTQNFNQMRDENTRLIWIEEESALNMAKPTYYDFGLEDSEEEPIYLYYVGTEFFDRCDPSTYDKNWRCWSAKPTEEQRENVKWAG